MDKYQIAIEEYKKGKSIKNICKEYHLTPKLLRNRLILENIEIRGHSTTKKEIPKNIINQILNDYSNKISIRKIAEKYNINRFDVSLLLKQYDIKISKRKILLDENFFEAIDTEEKAYWLGFLYADGNISNINIELTLKYDDINHLENFKKAIKTDATITDGYRKCDISTNPDKQLRYARLIVTSTKMVNDLIKLGCISNKSLALTFPTKEQVPNHLLIHFIRGYFDGDGCVYIDKSKTPSFLFQVCGTYDMLIHIKSYFDIKANVRKIGNYYDLRCKGNIKATNIFDTLYKDATIYLQRKYDIYKNFQLCRSRSSLTEDLERLERN